MRSFILLAASLLLGLALLTSVSAGQQGSGGPTAKKPETKTTPPAQATPDDGVPRITVAAAREALEKGTAIIVDVRSESSYRVGHVLGALWMPDIAQRTKELPRDKMIITYCS